MHQSKVRSPNNWRVGGEDNRSNNLNHKYQTIETIFNCKKKKRKKLLTKWHTGVCNLIKLLDNSVIFTKSYFQKAIWNNCFKKSCLGQKNSFKQLLTKHLFSYLTWSKQLRLFIQLFFIKQLMLPNRAFDQFYLILVFLKEILKKH